MRPQLTLLLLILTSLTLVSATVEKTPPATNVLQSETPVVFPLASNVTSQHKLNFLQRIMLKLALRKYKKADTEKADRQARSALAFGVTAMATFIAGLFIPYIAIIALPAGIVAIVLGNSALSNRTNETAKARLGRGLGWGSVIALAAVLVLAVVIISSWDW